MKKVDSYSSQYIGLASSPNAPSPEYNKNVEWMNEPSAWIFYPASLAVCVAMTTVFFSHTLADALTIANAIHGAFTFPFLHWIKGSADFYDQGAFNGLTLWEQIDAGEPWTNKKKYLMLVPTLLLLVTLVVSNYSTKYIFLNAPVWMILIIAKLPQMQGVRLFGINSTAGIDDDSRKRK